MQSSGIRSPAMSCAAFCCTPCRLVGRGLLSHANKVFNRVPPVVARIFSYCIITFMLFCSACALYAFLYVALVPTLEIVHPVYLEFDKDAQNGPKGVVRLRSPRSGWVMLSEDTASPRTPSGLVPGQAYDVAVNLVMPEAVENVAAGMFTVSLMLYDEDGAGIAQCSRATMLPYRSWATRMVSTAIWMGPVLTGWATESNTVQVNCISGFVEPHLIVPGASASGEIQGARGSNWIELDCGGTSTLSALRVLYHEWLEYPHDHYCHHHHTRLFPVCPCNARASALSAPASLPSTLSSPI